MQIGKPLFKKIKGKKIIFSLIAQGLKSMAGDSSSDRKSISA
jgi:hypothetical protein